MKIIFLDIDGVLNCETGYKNGFCNYVDLDYEQHNHYQTFYPPSKQFLNSLIKETHAKIVISSTWRSTGLEWLRKVWKAEQMSGEIIDITPFFYSKKFSVPRGCEIDAWLKEKGFWHINWSKEEQQKYVEKSRIENYIIIDDDSDMLLGQKNHFVHVQPSPRNYEGFHDKHYNLGKEILSKSIIELNYE